MDRFEEKLFTVEGAHRKVLSALAGGGAPDDRVSPPADRADPSFRVGHPGPWHPSGAGDALHRGVHAQRTGNPVPGPLPAP